MHFVPLASEPSPTFDDVCAEIARDPDVVYVIGTPTAKAVVISPARWDTLRAAVTDAAGEA